MDRAVRDDLLRTLSEFREHASELRFGQLIANLAFLARASGPSDV
jgi:hypothetical protein